MRYRPVKAVHVYTIEFKKINGLEIPTGRSRNFWQVRCNTLGNCGHAHRSEEACKPCLEKMKQQWTGLKSARAKAQWVQRRKFMPRPLVYNATQGVGIA